MTGAGHVLGLESYCPIWRRADWSPSSLLGRDATIGSNPALMESFGDIPLPRSGRHCLDRLVCWAGLMGKVAFRQRDVTRLIKGAIAAGLRIGTFGVQLIDGKPTLIPLDVPLMPTGGRQASSADNLLHDELEAWRAQHGQG